MTDAGRQGAGVRCDDGTSRVARDAHTGGPEATDGATADADVAALVVVCGLPGVGKSTVAKRIADHVDGTVLRTDVIRKELFTEPTYTETETERVYGELLDRARSRVADGDSVVLDATFADRRFRTGVAEAAATVADRFELVKVECDEAVVRRRIERRDGISDADFDVYLRFKEAFEPLDRDHVVIDNSGARATTHERVDTTLFS
ncbi:AAA family ATPase [Halorubrum vacuolatum]|uniref:Kinase n=1 Tax=Halorubrum vacuolatum TaxID=63740 RepID=A0A238X8H9_HALVU|nr:AAA family ATPase [Halorubrum vacuolatum]SNR54918.1 hypothetical protein SAMN06264855_11460 [Halorubrum vacuolatum]